MDSRAFYENLDDIMELPPGTVRGDETLQSFPTWDSLAVVSFIASCHGHFGVLLEAETVRRCQTVESLRQLVLPHLSDSGDGIPHG